VIAAPVVVAIYCVVAETMRANPDRMGKDCR
jgi:hypothetical protein